MIPPSLRLKQSNTSRLIPSRYSTKGIFDDLVSPEDIQSLYELESWTNDRLSNFGKLYNLPQEQWAINTPNATVVMAAFCHPNIPNGSRFNDSTLGAWYAAFSLETAFREIIYHKTKEFLEVGDLNNKTVQMREYIADFNSLFHDLRGFPLTDPVYNSNDYQDSQSLAKMLKAIDSNGIIYRSVRDVSGSCIVCFKPKMVLNIRQGNHYEFTWKNTKEPEIRKMPLLEPLSG